MMKISSLFIATLLISSETDVKYWDRNNQLTWQDFTVVEHLSSQEDANIHLTMENPYSFSNGIFKIEIRAAMTAGKSFVKNGHQNESLLKHEQGHFDIQELCARNLRKSVSEHIFNPYRLKIEIDSICAKNTEMIHNMHSLYDEETQHSKNSEKQKKWQKKIEIMLNELGMFSKIRIEKKII